MHRTLSAALFAVLLTACELGPFEVVTGSGAIVSEPREVAPFSKVAIAGAIDAVVVMGDTSVVLTADDNLMEHFEVKVEGGVLSVGPRGGISMHPSKTVEVRISTPQLVALSASGASKIHAEVAPIDRFEIGASGASRIEAKGLQCSELAASASGASVFVFQGSTDRLELGLSGASMGSLKDLSGNVAEVALSGASQADIVAAASVSGNLTGASRLSVRGSPAQRNVAVTDGSTLDYD